MEGSAYMGSFAFYSTIFLNDCTLASFDTFLSVHTESGLFFWLFMPKLPDFTSLQGELKLLVASIQFYLDFGND